MAASKGVNNWNKNWRGLGEIQTVIKTSASYYQSEVVRPVGTLRKDTPVTYVDSESVSHTRVAIRLGEEIYYTNIDNLVKPRSLGNINLKPQSFGLSGQKFSIINYISKVREAIISRQDIKGELQEYLLELVDFSVDGNKGITGYDNTQLPMASIVKDFSEVIGPIYSVKRGLTKFGLNVNNSSDILIPSSSAEPLLDYYVITMEKQIKISGKSKGTSNTLKMNDLVPRILNNQNLTNKYSSDREFIIMSEIHNNTMIQGPIKACVRLGIINQIAANSANTSSAYIPSKELFEDLISTDARLKNKENITVREISYLCEKELVNYSKQTLVSQKFKNIVNDVLNDEIYFVKFNIMNNIPSFITEATSGNVSINNLFFRSKNGYESKSDKLGFSL